MRHMQAVYSVYLIFYDGAEDEVRDLTAQSLDLGPVMAIVSMKQYANVTKASEMVRSWIDHQPINIFDYKCIDAASLGCGCYGKTSERIP